MLAKNLNNNEMSTYFSNFMKMNNSSKLLLFIIDFTYDNVVDVQDKSDISKEISIFLDNLF